MLTKLIQQGNIGLDTAVFLKFTSLKAPPTESIMMLISMCTYVISVMTHR
jgi:hypothetical protein